MFYFENVYKHTLIVIISRKMSERRIWGLCTLQRATDFPVSSGEIDQAPSDLRHSTSSRIVVS